MCMCDDDHKSQRLKTWLYSLKGVLDRHIHPTLNGIIIKQWFSNFFGHTPLNLCLMHYMGQFMRSEWWFSWFFDFNELKRDTGNHEEKTEWMTECIYLEKVIIMIYCYKCCGEIYSQVHKYWDIDTILTFLALYTTTMDFKWNKQDVL